MEIWGWIIAYVVGFSLLQLLVYRYVGSDEPTVERPAPGSSERTAARRLEPADGVASRPDGDTVHCQHCGSPNAREPVYTYCRECVAPLR